MATRKIHYSDGPTDYIGELFWDESRRGRRPAIVVFPEAFGLNDHARIRAGRLAELGYVALAADLHGAGRVMHDMAELRPAMEALSGDRTRWRSMARAALDALAEQPEVDSGKLAAIGFCFGGATCFELARSGAPVAGIVTFHAGLAVEAPGDAGRIQGKVLVCHGAEDPLVQKETIDAVMEELRRDKVDWQFIFYGNACHSFTDPEAGEHGMPGLAYDERNETRSWKVMKDFFNEVFG